MIACVRVDVRARGHVHARACVRACVRVALLIHHSTCMRHNVMLFVALPAPPKVSTLSNKRRDFRIKVMDHKMCVFTFSTTFI
jgi:hypothetical protein